MARNRSCGFSGSSRLFQTSTAGRSSALESARMPCPAGRGWLQSPRGKAEHPRCSNSIKREVIWKFSMNQRDGAVQTVQRHRQLPGDAEPWQDLGKGRIAASWNMTQSAEQLNSPMKCRDSECSRRVREQVLSVGTLEMVPQGTLA